LTAIPLGVPLIFAQSPGQCHDQDFFDHLS
jgi:hypothetical protein